jgi:hypothetical protein
MNLQAKLLKKDVQNDPSALVAMVVSNNPSAVALSIKGWTGEIVNENDVDGLMETFAHVISTYPESAHEIIYNVLNVPVIEQNLSPVGKEFVLEAVIDAETRNRTTKSGIFDTSLDDLNQEVASSGPTVNTTTTNGGGSFNWGPIVSQYIPGILAVFGITQQQNPNSAAPNTNNAPTVNWLLIIFVIVIVAIVGLLIYRASK